MGIGFTKASNVRVVTLVMQETGTYNSQYNRPYETNIDGDVIKMLTDSVMASHDKKMNSAMLGGLSSSFIQPRSQYESEAGIMHGWGEKRIRFLMELEISYAVGGKMTEYIQGYTSHNGVTVNGSIDPNMKFFINSVIQTRKNHVQTPLGYNMFETVIDNSHVLSAENWVNMYQPTQQRLMRPMDIFSNISASHLPGAFDNGGNVAFFDSTTTMKKEATKSNRNNGVGSQYAAKIIDGYTMAASLQDGFHQNENEIISNARGNVVENVAATDPFIAAMSQITSSAVGNSFVYNDLQTLDPNVMSVTNYTVPTVVQSAQIHRTGQTANWGGSDRTTLVATILSQSIPSLMMDLMIRRIAFTSTNHDMSGKMVTAILDAKGFTNMDIRPNCDMFIHRLQNEVLRDITFGNRESYAIEMIVNLSGETVIKISIGSNPVYDFVTPSFCDSLFVPVITTNPESIAAVVNDFSNLTNNIRDAMSSTYSGRQNNELFNQPNHGRAIA